jgi:glycosyltransferase involved in cell wall biosynthesis
VANDVDVTIARGGGSWWDASGVRLPCVQRFGRFASARLRGDAAYVWEQRSFAPSAYALARLGRFDVVHLHDPALTNALWHARRRFGGRFAIVFTNSGPLGPDHLLRPDLVQSVTPVDFDVLAEAGLPAARRVMVPYGVDRTEPPPRVFLDGPPRSLIGVGALNDGHKGFATAVRAVAGFPETSLRLLGQRDDETPGLERLGRELLGQRLSMGTLPSDQIGGALAAADAFVLPSHGEGFCIAVLEALEAGLPCVVSDIPVLRWLVGDAAVLVPPDRPDEWARAIAGLTPDIRRRLSARARQRASEFHWPALAGQYLTMYRKAIAAARRHP